jgi:hypothetical protein
MGGRPHVPHMGDLRNAHKIRLENLKGRETTRNYGGFYQYGYKSLRVHKSLEILDQISDY